MEKSVISAAPELRLYPLLCPDPVAMAGDVSDRRGLPLAPGIFIEGVGWVLWKTRYCGALVDGRTTTSHAA